MGLPIALASAGIAAEAGVWSVADTAGLAAPWPATRWLRILVEVIGVPVSGNAELTRLGMDVWAASAAPQGRR